MGTSPLIIVGIGSQAKAWALNLKDSKREFVIALKNDSRSFEKVNALNMKSISLSDPNLLNYDTFLMLIPDDQHISFFEKNKANLKPGAHFIYAHGYSMSRFQLNTTLPEFKHSLLAPKAIASDVRFQYETKGKIGAAFYAESEAEELFLKQLAKDVGFTALYKNHYRDEMVADLFSEQSILCSILPYAAMKSYNLLVEKGISSELAFMECFLELRSISAAIVNLGPLDFFKMISPNALVGSEKGKELIINADFDRALNKIYDDIINNNFYNEIDTKTISTRETVVERWQKEEITKTYNRLKSELI